MSIECRDYDGDGNGDLIMGGNLYKVKPEVGRYDASYGNLLLGDGKGSFRQIPKKVSGFWLNGEVRDMLDISTVNGRILVVARNDDPVQVFRIKKTE
jgi:hypothetical protein